MLRDTPKDKYQKAHFGEHSYKVKLSKWKPRKVIKLLLLFPSKIIHAIIKWK